MEQIEQKLLHDTESADPRSRHNAMITAIEADARLFLSAILRKTESIITISLIRAPDILLRADSPL